MDILKLQNDIACGICKAFCTNLTSSELKEIDAGTFSNPLYKKVSDRFNVFKNRSDALVFMLYPYPIIFLSMKTGDGQWSKPIVYNELDSSILDECFKDVHSDIKPVAMSLIESCLSMIIQSWNIHNIVAGTVPTKNASCSEETINQFKQANILYDKIYKESVNAMDILIGFDATKEK